MQLYTPIFTKELSAKKTEIYRVLPGKPEDTQLSKTLIATIQFNSKKQGIKIHSKGNWFITPDELNFINDYVSIHTK